MVLEAERDNSGWREMLMSLWMSRFWGVMVRLGGEAEGLGGGEVAVVVDEEFYFVGDGDGFWGFRGLGTVVGRLM